MCSIFSTHHQFISSSNRDVEDSVLTYVAVSRFPLNIKGAGSGITDTQVSNTTQRLCDMKEKGISLGFNQNNYKNRFTPLLQV